MCLVIRLARPEPGEIVVDPMCGGGSISIEVRDDNWMMIHAHDRQLLVGHYLIILLVTTMI